MWLERLEKLNLYLNPSPLTQSVTMIDHPDLLQTLVTVYTGDVEPESWPPIQLMSMINQLDFLQTFQLENGLDWLHMEKDDEKLQKDDNFVVLKLGENHMEENVVKVESRSVEHIENEKNGWEIAMVVAESTAYFYLLGGEFEESKAG